MSIFFPNESLLLLLTPKVGSTWLRKVIAESGVEHIILGDERLRGHDDLNHHRRADYKRIACFVRHPLSWHYSYWQYKQQYSSQWTPDKLEYDRLCMSECFDQYLNKVETNYPNDMRILYERFAGTEDNPVWFIGKQENLAEDFKLLMDKAGIDMPQRVMNSDKRINTGSTHIDLTPYEQQVYRNNIDTYIRFNYSKTP